ncbi:MAG: DUF123 domain-containing protein [Candidatus Thermoplasmatota archaeon]
MKGSYLLIIKVDTTCTLQLRKHHTLITPGSYGYVGSAMKNLESRILRHARRDKKHHWHIDYLLDYGEIVDIYYKESTIHEECDIARFFEQHFPSISSFGCSDCTCTSHLFFGAMEDLIRAAKQLHMNKYHLDAKS